jgi:hypothetical protein
MSVELVLFFVCVYIVGIGLGTLAYWYWKVRK